MDLIELEKYAQELLGLFITSHKIANDLLQKHTDAEPHAKGFLYDCFSNSKQIADHYKELYDEIMGLIADLKGE